MQRGRWARCLYLPHGPTVAGAGTADAIGSVLAATRDRRLDFARVEPVGAVDLDALNRLGGRRVGDTQPSRTWVLDLGPDEDKLLKGLTHGHRSSLKIAAREEVGFWSSSDGSGLYTFLQFLRNTTARGGFQAHPDAYYRTLLTTLGPLSAARLFVAEASGHPVSAAIGFDFQGVRHYAHAAADQGESRRTGASVALVWHMITDAKAAGMRTFDFWGVAPADAPNHPWAGLSKFKMAFGGQPLQRLGTWEIPVSRVRYRTYASVRRFIRGQ